MQTIQKMAPGTPWFSEDSNGRIVITDAIWKSGQRKLPLLARMALALTDLCSRRGLGRVYAIAQHPNTNNNIERDNFRAGSLFRGVAQLCYVPEKWSLGELNDWNSMDPMDQLNRVSARNGWIPDRMPVLSIDVQLEMDRPSTPTLDAGTTGRVTIYICSSKAHVGLTSEMRAQCCDTTATGFREGSNRQASGADFVITSWRKLETFATSTGMEILDRLEIFHRHGLDDIDRSCISTYASLINMLVTAGEEAVKLGVPYGTQLTKD